MTTTSPPKRIDFNTPELQRKRRIARSRIA